MQNLTRKLNNFNQTEKPKKKGFKFRRVWIARIVIVLIILLIAVYFPARSAYSAYKQIVASSKLISAGAKAENLDQIKQGITATKESVATLDSSLNWMFWIGLIPIGGGYYNDAHHFVKAAEYELDAADTISTALTPYKDEVGLNGQATAGQDRVAQGLKILEKVLPMMDRIEPDMKNASDEVAGIDVNKYPEMIGSHKVRSNLLAAKNLIVGADIALTQHKDALTVAPDALGETTPKNYLLLFQNDKELRATGGFLTAYAYLHIDKGHLTTTGSDDIYRLDEQLQQACQHEICPLTPPAPIVKYLPEANGKPRTSWSLRDSNLSPDLPTSMAEFEKMYSYLHNGTKFDGVITIDTQVVEDLMKVTGPIDVLGTTYSANNDPQCNCSDVVYQLEHYAEIAAEGQSNRKAILGALMQQILARSLGAGVSKLPEFINTGITLANDKHVMFYMHDPATEQALSGLNWTGQIRQTDGDYLNINDSNFAGGKSNLYVEEAVTDEITTSNATAVKHKLTIVYTNPQPFNSWLNGILRDYIRVYVPEGSQLIGSDGSDVKVATQDDTALHKTYFEAFTQVRPQNSVTLTFEYTTPTTVSGNHYPLLIQKQPGSKDQKYTIKINGSTKSQFTLTSDQNLDLSF